MEAIAKRRSEMSIGDAEAVLAIGAGAVLLLLGTSRRSLAGSVVALASVPLFYRGVTGHWPDTGMSLGPSDDTRVALAGTRGAHVRESVRIEAAVGDVYRFWRRLENLPAFMKHLTRVTETSDRTSHWVAEAPGGLVASWDAEIINDVEDELIAWRSLPGSEVAVAGSVNFKPVRNGRSTQVDVNLQYSATGGKVGALLASLFGREPSQTIREDLRRLRQLMEAGEVARGENH
jgi:uncharacterized membrane protein